MWLRPVLKKMFTTLECDTCFIESIRMVLIPQLQPPHCNIFQGEEMASVLVVLEILLYGTSVTFQKLCLTDK